MKQRIGILGSGVVAQALAAGFLRHGYEVMVGTRSPEKVAGWTAEMQVGTFGDAAAFGEILVLAVGGRVAADALGLVDGGDLAGKVIIDPTNPIADAPPDNGVLRYFTGPNESLMEILQGKFPEARFVKAFNSVGSGHMVDPQFPGGKPTMFICGNDADAKAAVARIVVEFGWESEDVGFVESARALESLCQLWCIPGILRNEWTHAFHLLKLQPALAGA